MRPFVLPLLFLGAFLPDGLDASENSITSDKAISSEQFQCVVDGKYYDEFVGRPWKSNGRPDTVGAMNMKNAHSAGLHWDLPVFTPCLLSSCARPALQMEAFLNYLNNRGLIYTGGLFIEVLGASDWGSDRQLNRQRMEDFTGRLGPGIFTNKTSWEAIMGNDYTEYHDCDLWILELDGNPHYSNFTRFGGWSTPFMKQYGHGPVQGCNFTADLIIRNDGMLRKHKHK